MLLQLCFFVSCLATSTHTKHPIARECITSQCVTMTTMFGGRGGKGAEGGEGNHIRDCGLEGLEQMGKIPGRLPVPLEQLQYSAPF